MEIEREYSILGDLVKAYRLKAGLSQDEVAKRLNLSRVSVANIESGRQRVVLHQALELAKVLNFTLKEFEQKAQGALFDEQLQEQPKQIRNELSGVLKSEREKEE